ncbi:MAG: hypothetical protein E7Z88_08390 [Cyanobacteria bacterium SIG27]|nr:hypothetical protein [Cyanobacteria bacterium SIG27]
MKISPVNNNNFKYSKQNNSNPIAFGDLINDIYSKWESKKKELVINPVTKKPDSTLTNIAQMVYRHKFDEPEKLLEAVIDAKTGEVANKQFNELTSLVFQKTGDTLFWNTVFKFDNFMASLRSGLWEDNFGGFAPNDIDFARILNTFKDKDGHFRKRNRQFFYAALRTAAKGYDKDSMISLNHVCDIVDISKGENGVVSSARGALALLVLGTTKNFEQTLSFLEISRNRTGKQNLEIINIIDKELPGSFDKKIANFPCYSKYCFDENAQPIPDMLNFAKRLIEKNDAVYNPWHFVLGANGDYVQDFVVENLTTCDKKEWEAYYFGLFAKSLRSSFTFDETVDFALRWKNIKGTFEGLDEVAYASTYVEDTEEEIEEYEQNLYVDLETFEDIVLFNEFLYKADFKKYIKPQIICDILIGQFRPELLPYDERVALLESLNVIAPFLDDAEQTPSVLTLKAVIPDAILDLKSVLRKEDVSIAVKKDDKFNFINQILASKDNAFSDFECVLVESIPLLEQLTDGIPLEYSRMEFISDLQKVIGDVEAYKNIFKKIGVNEVLLYQDMQMYGFNGILTTSNLDLSDEKEKEVYEIVNRFLYQNSAKTGNDKLDNYLNTIFAAIPEFLSVVQKTQHKTQKYSMDVHMLLVMAYSIQNPMYMELKQNEKSYLKFATLLHDIAKKEDVVDSGHQYLSSEYVDSIAKKFFSHPEIRKRVVEFVCSHHWLALYNTGENDAVETAYQFRKDNDFKMAQIMARADLMAVREEFYNRYSKALNSDMIDPVQHSIDVFSASSGAYLTHSFANKAKMKKHKEIFNNQEYNVINLKKLESDADVSELGFRKGTKKSDLRLCVHMVDENNIDLALNTVKSLSKPANHGVISASIITPSVTRTYRNREHGLLLAQPSSNILTAYQNNIYSGYRKSLEWVLSELCSPDSKMAQYRESFRWHLFEHLDIQDSDENAYEYGDFYKNYLSKITSLSQIDENQEFKIADKTFLGKDLINAIKSIEDNLIDFRGINHNEVIIYLPRIEGVISKAESLEQVPAELLEFAQSNNLPVVLI